MRIPRQLVVWASAAILSLAILFIVMRWQHRYVQRRVAVQVAARPAAGSAIFRAKGCATCHGTSANGSSSGPSLRDSQSLTTLPRLVTAMWNHAPHMWEEMQARQLPYPTLSYDETAQLVTYLYMSAYADGAGDVDRGQHLFVERKCAECHEETARTSSPSLLAISDADDPLSWTQVLWNHAPAMQQKIDSKGGAWPIFHASDMRDLFAYVRSTRGLPADDPPDIAGDPNRGWELFQQKGCLRCHAFSATSPNGARSFGADRPLPPTFSEFGANLLNHFPRMKNAFASEKSPLPRFENHDVADIAVFIYSLHYLEPTGSPQVGKSIFGWRGCSQCHGDNAEGTTFGPPLRGRGQVYTAVRLATSLWAHGGRMYRSTQHRGQPWPVLQDADVGHLLTFLNTSPEP